MQRGLIAICLGLILVVTSFASAAEVSLDISIPRESLNAFVKTLDGTTISYEGRDYEDLKAARLKIERTRIIKVEEGQILVDLEGGVWIRYHIRPEEALGIPMEGSMEIQGGMDFQSEIALIPRVDGTSKKLVLSAMVMRLSLKKAQGISDLLFQIPGVQQIIRFQVNRALQGMRPEILDLSPYMVQQEFDLQESHWKADHTLSVEPVEIRLEVKSDVLWVRISARVDSKAKKEGS